MKQINIFDEVIEECCSNPITGYFRDGFCHTDKLDRGLHVVCAQITDEFLDFSKSRGNDLSTPRPEFNFPGLKEGDSWCLCAERWKEAFECGFAPKIYLKRTNKKALKVIDLHILKDFALDLSQFTNGRSYQLVVYLGEVMLCLIGDHFFVFCDA